MTKELAQPKLDKLHEIVNTGAKNAARAMAELIDNKISVSVPEIQLIPVTSLIDHLGGTELLIVGLYFRFNGDISGGIMLFFPETTAQTLLSDLTGNMNPVDPVEKNDLEKSALKETGNIMVNSYVNAIARSLSMNINLSVPYYAKDTLSAVSDVLLIQLAETSDQALLLTTVIDSSEQQLSGSIVIFPDVTSYVKIFKALGLQE
jgi:chemotaxis protein CheC